MSFAPGASRRSAASERAPRAALPFHDRGSEYTATIRPPPSPPPHPPSRRVLSNTSRGPTRYGPPTSSSTIETRTGPRIAGASPRARCSTRSASPSANAAFPARSTSPTSPPPTPHAVTVCSYRASAWSARVVAISFPTAASSARMTPCQSLGYSSASQPAATAATVAGASDCAAVAPAMISASVITSPPKFSGSRR